MSEINPVPNPGQPGEEAHSERIQHNPAVARVPERVARGAFATGLLVFTGQHEFVLDFLQGLARPPQVTARVVLPAPILEQLVGLLREGLTRYIAAHGLPAGLPKNNPGEKPRSAQDIYAELKVPDDLLSGTYANAMIINYSPAEFHIDFITSFYPNAAVACRVYVAASRVPSLIDTLTVSLGNYNRARTPPPPPPAAPPTPPQAPPQPPVPPAGPSNPA